MRRTGDAGKIRKSKGECRMWLWIAFAVYVLFLCTLLFTKKKNGMIVKCALIATAVFLFVAIALIEKGRRYDFVSLDWGRYDVRVTWNYDWLNDSCSDVYFHYNGECKVFYNKVSKTLEISMREKKRNQKSTACFKRDGMKIEIIDKDGNKKEYKTNP